LGDRINAISSGLSMIIDGFMAKKIITLTGKPISP
jgi:hypothetical protein